MNGLQEVSRASVRRHQRRGGSQDEFQGVWLEQKGSEVRKIWKRQPISLFDL